MPGNLLTFSNPASLYSFQLCCAGDDQLPAVYLCSRLAPLANTMSMPADTGCSRDTCGHRIYRRWRHTCGYRSHENQGLQVFAGHMQSHDGQGLQVHVVTAHAMVNGYR